MHLPDIRTGVASLGVFVIMAAVLISFASADTTHAATYDPDSDYYLENCLPLNFPSSNLFIDPDLGPPATPPCNVKSAATSTAADVTTSFNVAAPHSNFAGVVLTLGDPDFVTAADADIDPNGQTIGGLSTSTSLGLINGACITGVPVDFILYESSVSGSLTTNPEGTPDRWADPDTTGSAGGGPDGIVLDEESAGLGNDLADSDSPFVGAMPDIYLPLFDPDLDYPGGPNGGIASITPRARYTGATRVPAVTGDWQLLTVMNFDADALTPFAEDASNYPHIFGTAGLSGMNVSMTLLNDIGATQTSPSTIVDFCTPLVVDITVLGTSSGSDTRFTTPAASGQYDFFQLSTGYRDADGDGIENQFDTCPFAANIGNSRQPTGPANGDQDIDGIDDSCDIASTAGVLDVDSDGFNNRQDGCPQIADGGASQKNSEFLTTYAATAPDSGPKGDGITDACDPNDFDSVTEGGFTHAVDVMPVCIGETDANDDGICDATSGSYNTAADADFDGFSEALEAGMGTDAFDPCADTTTANDEDPDPYPPDFDDNRTINIVDVLKLKPVFGTPSARHDLNGSGGNINIVDVLKLKPVFGDTCVGP